MTAAEIAARKAMLAALEAARLVTRDTVNAASAKLNTAVANGDRSLLPLVETLTPVVIALNGYRPKLQAEIAATDLLVPSDPVFTVQPNPGPVEFAHGQAAEKTVSYAVSKGEVSVVGDLPQGVSRTLLPGKVVYNYDGTGAPGSTTNELEAL